MGLHFETRHRAFSPILRRERNECEGERGGGERQAVHNRPLRTYNARRARAVRYRARARMTRRRRARAVVTARRFVAARPW